MSSSPLDSSSSAESSSRKHREEEMPGAPAEPPASETGKTGSELWSAYALIVAALKKQPGSYQAALAEKLGMPKQWISQFMRGERRVPSHVWLKLWEFAELGSRREAALQWFRTYEVDIDRDDWESTLPKKDLTFDGRSLRAKNRRIEAQNESMNVKEDLPDGRSIRHAAKEPISSATDNGSTSIADSFVL